MIPEKYHELRIVFEALGNIMSPSKALYICSETSYTETLNNSFHYQLRFASNYYPVEIKLTKDYRP